MKKLAWETWGAAVSTVLWAICLLVLYLVPGQTIDHSGPKEIMVIDDRADSLFSANLALAIIAFVFGAIGLIRKRKALFVLPIIGALCVNPFFCLGPIFERAGDYNDWATLVAKDQTEYHLLASHFLQGSSLAIARKLDGSRGVNKYEILARSSWEAQFGYLVLVRPQGATDEPTLYQTADGVLLGASGGNGVYTAYDPNKDIAYGQNDMSGDHHVNEISPFCLLGPSDKPNEQDFRDLMTIQLNSLPLESAVKPDLNHPNPRVRQMASELIKKLQGNMSHK